MNTNFLEFKEKIKKVGLVGVLEYSLHKIIDTTYLTIR